MISVIIPTRNRADLLAPALNSLTRQILPIDTFEVLVVDNGSTDNTAQVAHNFLELLGNLRYFYEPEAGLHAGRHRGMLEAKGEILVFADDDIEATPTWLSSIQEVFIDSSVALVGGNNLPLFMEPPPPWLVRLWERPTRIGGRALPSLSILELTWAKETLSPHYVWGCNFSIRKSVLLAAGGFHPDGMPKELIRFRGDGETHVSNYVAASGMKCLFHPGATVYHKVTPERMSFSYFRQRGFGQGVSDSYTALRRQDMGNANRQRNMLYRAARWGWRKLKRLTITDAEIKRALNELEAGHHEGYAYHQRMYQKDAEVRAWVHKIKYFEERAK